MGNMYFDLTGSVMAKNIHTGDSVEIQFHPKGWKTQSFITGSGYDSDFNRLYDITGSWVDNIKVKSMRRCITETVWQNTLKNDPKQYGLTSFAIGLN